MIAKRVQRGDKSSSFQTLADYVLDRKGRGQKVLSAWSVNCATPDDLDLAAIEIRATQEMNTRSKIDKTYHLVVSLAAGESLGGEEFKVIEHRFSEALGFSEHQRIAVLHNDTNYLHMHLCISKIHPLSFNAIEPYYDKFKLQDICRDLEKEFGLKVGVSPEKSKKRALPGEVHQGLETFETWIKENIREELCVLIKTPEKNWQDVQDLLGQYGIQIRERGAGLVFSHVQKKLFVKASSIDRTFGKKNLEKLLGPFETLGTSVKPSKLYRPKPLKNHDKKNELYEIYESEMSELKAKRSSLLSRDRELVYKQIEEIKKRYAERRQEVRRDSIIAKGRKRVIFEKLSAEMKKEMETVFSNSKTSREHLKEANRLKSWREWTFDRANKGDETALEVLRQKIRPFEDFGLGIIVGKDSKHVLFNGLPRKISKDGIVEYRSGEGSFFDTGNVISVKNLETGTLQAALLAAQAKFGREFEFKGTEEFLKAVSLLVSPRPKEHSIKVNKEIDRGV